MNAVDSFHINDFIFHNRSQDIALRILTESNVSHHLFWSKRPMFWTPFLTFLFLFCFLPR